MGSEMCIRDRSDRLGTESRETNNLVLVLDTSNSRVVHDVENLKVIEQEEGPDCGNNAKEIVHRSIEYI